MTANPYGVTRMDIPTAIEAARRQHEAKERAWQEWEHLTFGSCPSPAPLHVAHLSVAEEAWETWLRETFPGMN